MIILMFLLSCFSRPKVDDFSLVKHDNEKVLNNKVDANIIGNDGHTMLYHAVKNNNRNIVSFLLENGAEVALKDAFGKIVLDYILEDELVLGPIIDAVINLGTRSQALNRKYKLEDGRELSIEEIAQIKYSKS